MADDYSADINTTGRVWHDWAPGSSGVIETPGDEDWFEYVHSNNHSRLTITASFAVVRITIYDRDNNLIDSYYGATSTASINLHPVFFRTYYVSIQGFNADGTQATGTYTLNAGPVVDDYPGGITTTATLPTGGTVSGTLDTLGDHDAFRISGQAGESVRFQFTDAAFVQGNISILNEFGNVVTSQSGDIATLSLTFEFDGFGPYYVAVTGFSAGGATFAYGTYTLAAQTVIIPDDHGDDFATATPMIVDGAPVTIAHDGMIDSDWLSFHAQAGVPIHFDFNNDNGARAFIRFYDQYGRQLFGEAITTDFEYHAYTFDSDGVYYIQVTTDEPLSLQLRTPVDDFAGNLSTTGVLQVDGPAVSGRHDFFDDLDVFAVSLSAPGIYRFEITPASLGRVHEILAIYDENGNLLDAALVWRPGVGLTFEAEAAGQYYVGVLNDVTVGTHDQVYSLFAYSATDDYDRTTATAGVLTIDGGPTSAAINYNEDVDWFAFTVTAGQVVRFQIDAIGFDPLSINIYNDAGVRVTWEWEEEDFHFSARDAQTFYLGIGEAADGRTYLGTGTYTINLTNVPTENSLATPLTIGTPVDGILTYAGGDDDLFVFTAEAGQTVRFHVEGDFVWRLWITRFDANGIPENIVIEPLRGNAAIGHTFAETDTYYISVRGSQPTTVSTDDLGPYTLHSTIVTDDAGQSPNTASTIVLDGPAVNGVVNYENDTDWFAITVEAGDTVRINATYDPSMLDLHVGLGPITDGISRVHPEGFIHRFDEAGTYYISVYAPYYEIFGGSYTLTAVTFADDYANSVSTTAQFAVSGPAFVGQLEHGFDRDWAAIELEAGETYIFTLSGSTQNSPFGMNGSIDIHDATGAVLVSTGLNAGHDTQIVFTASHSGTFYAEVSTQNVGSANTSNYTLSANILPPSLIEAISPGLPRLPDNTFGHDHLGAPNVIQLYFANGGDSFAGHVSQGWFAEEIDAVMEILAAFEAVLNIDFQVTETLAYADAVLTTFDDPGSLSTFWRADWDVPIPVVGFSYTSPLWTQASVAPGGLGGAMVLNAMGYALGLAFPHVAEGDSPVMEGVTDPFDTGDFDLNQGVYTIMSFNDGWVTSPYGQSANQNNGWQITPMALDIAALQALYGANTTANAGATTYTLTDSNTAGTGWRAIWDTGGVDTIAYAGALGATIDLRPATLTYQIGGGGYLSFVPGVHGGFTIAYGAVIENATGGGGADTLIGSNAANTLSGGGGGDVLSGGAGNDTMVGGAGVDTARYAMASSSATWARSANGGWTVTSADGVDTLTNVEVLDFLDQDFYLTRVERSFSGDRTSDILFRSDAGTVASWNVNGVSLTAATFLGNASASQWSVLGTGDFNGDGRDDVIWQHSSTLIYGWRMNGSTIDAGVAFAGVGTEWKFLGAGDFNWDGVDDFAWQHVSGVVFTWEMGASGIASAGYVTGLGLEWKIQGFGDFNGDNHDDFLWRNANTGQSYVWMMDGRAIAASGPTSSQVGNDWTIVGIGDFNVDGRDDILWQSPTGQIASWQMNGGQVTGTSFYGSVNPAQWSVANVGDYNGDGRDDILFTGNGVVYVWLLGEGVIASSGIIAGVGGEWDVIGD